MSQIPFKCTWKGMVRIVVKNGATIVFRGMVLVENIAHVANEEGWYISLETDQEGQFLTVLRRLRTILSMIGRK